MTTYVHLADLSHDLGIIIHHIKKTLNSTWIMSSPPNNKPHVTLSFIKQPLCFPPHLTQTVHDPENKVPVAVCSAGWRQRRWQKLHKTDVEANFLQQGTNYVIVWNVLAARLRQLPHWDKPNTWDLITTYWIKGAFMSFIQNSSSTAFSSLILICSMSQFPPSLIILSFPPSVLLSSLSPQSFLPGGKQQL